MNTLADLSTSNVNQQSVYQDGVSEGCQLQAVNGMQVGGEYLESKQAPMRQSVTFSFG